MILFGVIRQISDNGPFVYCMCETRARAESIAASQRNNEVVKNSRYWVEPIKDNACIGDDLYLVKVPA